MADVPRRLDPERMHALEVGVRDLMVAANEGLPEGTTKAAVLDYLRHARGELGNFYDMAGPPAPLPRRRFGLADPQPNLGRVTTDEPPPPSLMDRLKVWLANGP